MTQSATPAQDSSVANICHTLTKQGSRCKNKALNGHRFCAIHRYRETAISPIPVQELKGILAEHLVWITSQQQDGQPGDLSFRDLRNACLSDANIQGVSLVGADLEAADLRGATLSNADLRNAWLLDADIERADLRMVKGATKDQIQQARNWLRAFYSTDLMGALGLPPDHNELLSRSGIQMLLGRSNLQGLDLSAIPDIRALKEELKQAKNWMLATYSQKALAELGLPPNHNDNIIERNLSKLNIQDQDISESKLAGFILRSMNLQGAMANRADFSNSDLTEANFRRASLRQASFNDANLRDADFLGSDLTAASLVRANIQGARLRQAIGLTVSQIHTARNWRLAYYSGDLLTALGLSQDHNERIDKKDLSATQTFRNADLAYADLSHFDLHNASFESSSFQNAILLDANLQEAILSDARHLPLESLRSARNWVLAFYSQDTLSELGLPTDHNTRLAAKDFRKADLSRANLKGANLQDYDLRDSNLEESNLTETKGLTARSLAGAKVSNAVLPNVLTLFDEKKTVEELVRYSRRIFTLMMLLAFYALLTVVTTTDVKLLKDSLSDPIPISRMTLPVYWLYAGIPIILIALYTYFHVNLQRLWESLSLLPSHFPDGRPVDNVVFPWIGNGIVRLFLPQLSEKIPLFVLQTIITIIMVWWVVPATLLLMFARYLPMHDWVITGLHVALFSLSVGLAVGFGQLTAEPLAKLCSRRRQSMRMLRISEL